MIQIWEHDWDSKKENIKNAMRKLLRAGNVPKENDGGVN